MTLVAALTVTRRPIAAFDATPALPVFAVGAVHVRDVPGDFGLNRPSGGVLKGLSDLLCGQRRIALTEAVIRPCRSKALLIKCGPLVTGGTRGVKHPVHAIDINSSTAPVRSTK